MDANKRMDLIQLGQAAGLEEWQAVSIADDALKAFAHGEPFWPAAPDLRFKTERELASYLISQSKPPAVQDVIRRP